MASRRETAPSVALFPFLAVLVCAMGALILLLLVMTRRIRSQAELRLQETALAPAAAPILPDPVVPEPPPAVLVAPPRPAERLPAPTDVSAWSTPAPPVLELPPPKPIVIDPTFESRRAAQLRQHAAAQQELDRTWQQTVARLSRERSSAAEAVAQLRNALSARQRDLEQARRDIDAEQRRQAETAARTSDLGGDKARLAERQVAVQREIDSVARQLEALQLNRQTESGRRFTFVPFDALSGTTRRPIVIECQRDRLVLVSEGITLTADDLDGFIPHYNPLSAGVRTLTDAFERVDGPGQVPYVLLIVRPEGTISYYAARMFLQPLNLPFGYELVGSDQEFTWETTDARISQRAREAIAEVLREKSRVTHLSRMSGRDEEPLRLRGRGGEFRLDEVERLKQPGRSVQFGGQRLDREQYTAGGSSDGAAGEGDRRGLGLLRRGGTEPAAGGASGASNRTGEGSGGGATTGGTTTERREASANPSGRPAGGSETPRGGGWMPGSGFGSASRPEEPFDWRPRLGSGIGILRDVRVHVSGENLTVQGSTPLAITPETSVHDLSRLLAEELDRLQEEWGRAPQGFYWNPSLVLEVTPEGAVAAGKLGTAAKAWGLGAEIRPLREATAPAGAAAPVRAAGTGAAVR